jgi:glycosyltransferase involved in cell wall biosynthesis
MIGDGELLGSAKARLRESRMDEVACLPGSCDDIPDQLRNMDVFVLGSLREGISNTILEAMASGLPVIASDTGGNPELIEAGANGELVPPGDRRALAQAIRDYLQDPERRARHGLGSRDRVMSFFSIERMVDNYRALYLNALGMQETG